MESRELAAAAIAFFGMTGGLTLSLYGTHYYDNVMSLFTLRASPSWWSSARSWRTAR